MQNKPRKMYSIALNNMDFKDTCESIDIVLLLRKYSVIIDKY